MDQPITQFFCRAVEQARFEGIRKDHGNCPEVFGRMDAFHDGAVLRNDDVTTGRFQFHLIDDGQEIPFDTDDGRGESELERKRQARREDKVVADMDGLSEGQTLLMEGKVFQLNLGDGPEW